MGFLNWPYVEGKSAWGELTSKAGYVLSSFRQSSESNQVEVLASASWFVLDGPERL
jgi:hypothetical protein